MNIYLTEMLIYNEDFASGYAKVAGPRIETQNENHAESILVKSGYLKVTVIGMLVN